MSEPTPTTTPSIQGSTASSDSSIITNIQSGHAEGRQRHRGRGGGAGSRQGGHGAGANARRNTRLDHRNEKSAAFKGGTLDMNSHVFQCCSQTTNNKIFSITLEKLTYYTSKTFKSTTDLDPIFKRFTTPHINKLIKPKSMDAVDIAIFKEDVK